MTYTDEECVAAVRRWGEEAGYPGMMGYRAERRRPSTDAIVTHLGSWSNAVVLAGFEPYLPGGEHNTKSEEDAGLVRRVDEGERLSDIAKEYGTSGQSLGRRVRRARRRLGLPDRRLPPGRPSR